jgi:dsRNA-specific ribonuclease
MFSRSLTRRCFSMTQMTLNAVPEPIQKLPLLWTDLKEADQAKFTAFAHRTGLKLSKPDLLLTALTHKSYAADPDCSFDRMRNLGKSYKGLIRVGEKAISLFISEFLYQKYPKLPANAIDALVRTYSGVSALYSVAETFGVVNVMRWKVE